MNDEQFWSIIAHLDWGETGDDEAVIEPAITALASTSVDLIEGFDDRLAEKLHALDTEAHAREMGQEAYRGPDEDFAVDWFLHARCCVVANGRTFFERVLADPASMPEDEDFEAILWVAASAYHRMTGQEFTHVPPVSYETFSNRAGWKR